MPSRSLRPLTLNKATGSPVAYDPGGGHLGVSGRFVVLPYPPVPNHISPYWTDIGDATCPTNV